EIGGRHGFRAVRLADGSLVMTAPGHASIEDAINAARCALALRRLVPDAFIAVATGRCSTASPLPLGEALERAALLAEARHPMVLVDGLTASLLPPRFQREAVGEQSYALSGESHAVDAPRL